MSTIDTEKVSKHKLINRMAWQESLDDRQVDTLNNLIKKRREFSKAFRSKTFQLEEREKAEKAIEIVNEQIKILLIIL